MSKNTLTRRTVLRALGILGLGAALPLPALAAAPAPAIRMADVARTADKRYKMSETRLLMGTFVAVTLLHESKDGAAQAMDRAFGEIERLSAVFDRHRPDTPVAELNRGGRLTDVAPELRAVMNKAVDFGRLSSGAFNVTVLPVVELFRSHANPGGRMELSERELSEALELVHLPSVRMTKREIRFDRPGMGVTLDGIGKGFIVDAASDVLARHGAADHLINAGGDMRARGERAPGQPWKVAVEDPHQRGDYPAVLHLRDAAVATSGGYEVFFDADHRHHHIIDPRTAHSPNQSVSVTVTAPTVMEADALATSVFVMAPKKGVRFVDQLPGKECLLLGKSGAKVTSTHWNAMVSA